MATEQSELSVLISGRDSLSPTLSQLESKLIRFVGAVSSAVAAVKLVTMPVISASNFEREMANVTKTTQFTKSQIDSLGASVLDLSLRLNVSAVDLAKIAAAAGQQGLGRDGVEGIRIFTESVARMASVLDISADQAAADIGKILNVFRISITESERVSSAFNQVSNNSTARGSQLLDIVKRIGDAGNSLKLDQSIALAATGLDLGLNPEVIGTSFVKVFAKFRTSSKEFGKLVYGDIADSQKQWLDTVSTDGIKALKLYTEALRNKGVADQAQIISTLSGQGRIYGLVSKLVQDTEDRVIGRNLRQATTGFTEGLSSIREQATVLNTVNAQVEILSNSFVKLGTDAATPQLGQLKTALGELAEGLQSDGVKAFASALITGLGELFGAIRTGIKWLADLNVNWGNFIMVAKVFLALKLAEAMIALTARLPGVALGLQLIAKASKQSGDAGVQAAMAEGTAIDVLKAKRLALLAAKQAAYLAEREMQIAALALDNARAAAVPLQQAIRPLAIAAGAAGTASATAEAQRAAVQAEANAKIATSTATHEARMNAIRATYQGQRRVAQIAARDAEILAEEQFYARSQRSLNAHNSRKILAAEQSAAAALALQAETNAKLLEAQAAYSAKSREIAAALQASLAAGAAAGAAGQAAAQAAVGFSAWAAAMGRFLVLAGRFLITAALWVTILYTIADALGLVEKAGAFFGALADKIGLVSRKQAELAEQTRIAQEAWRKHRLEIDEVTEAYSKLLDATGRVRPTLIKAQLDSLKNETRPEARQQVIAEILGRTTGAETIAKDVQGAAGGDLNPQVQQAKLDALQKQLDAAKKDQDTANRSLAQVGANEASFTRQMREINAANARYEAISKQMAEQRNLLGIAQRASPEGIQASIAARGANLQAEDARNVQIVTAASKAVLETIGAPLVAARTELADVTAKIAKQGTIPGNVDEQSTKDKQKAQDVSLAELTARQSASRAAIAELENRLIVAQTNAPNKNEANAIGLAAEIAAKATPIQLNAFLASVGRAQKAGAALSDGSNIGAPEPDAPATGDDPPTPTSKELSEAQKLAKAKAELALKGSEDAVRLARAQVDAEAKINQDKYEQGLLSIEEFYRKQEALELAQIASERNKADKDIATKRIEQSQLTKESDRVRVQADINSLENDRKVLDQQARNTSAATVRSIANAKRTFSESSTADQLELAKFFGIENVQEFFNKQFGSYVDAARIRIAQLKSEIANAPGDTAGNAARENQIVDITDQARMKAYADTMAEFAKRTALADSAYSRFMGNQQVLKAQGKVTDQDIVNAEIVARNALLTSIEAEIKQRASLLPEKNKGTLAYQQEAAAIDDLKLKYNQLASAADATAVAVNNAVESSIAAALKEVELGYGDSQAQRQAKLDIDAINLTADAQRDALARMRDERSKMSLQSISTSNIDQQIAAGNKALDDLQKKSDDIRKKNATSNLQEFVDTLRKMATSIASTMLDILNKNIAQNFIKSALGGGGNGGIGGFFSGLLGGNDAPKGNKGDPLYVQTVDGATLGGKDPISDVAGLAEQSALGTVKTKVKDVFDNLLESVGTSLGSFGRFLSVALQNIFASLSSSGGGGAGIFGSLIQMGVSLWAGGGDMGTFDVDPGIAGGGADLGDLSFLSGIHHTGGLVGSPGTSRLATPAMFENAMRFHTGGVLGLAPDERPIIGRVGEEMLTAGDPRHRNNGGLDGGGDTYNSVTVNVTDSGSETNSTDSKSAELGKVIANVVQAEIIKQKRPGGLLSS